MQSTTPNNVRELERLQGNCLPILLESASIALQACRGPDASLILNSKASENYGYAVTLTLQSFRVEKFSRSPYRRTTLVEMFNLTVPQYRAALDFVCKLLPDEVFIHRG